MTSVASRALVGELYVRTMYLCELNSVKTQGRSCSGPFSFEGLVTFPLQANHTLGIFILFCNDWGVLWAETPYHSVSKINKHILA